MPSKPPSNEIKRSNWLQDLNVDQLLLLFHHYWGYASVLLLWIDVVPTISLRHGKCVNTNIHDRKQDSNLARGEEVISANTPLRVNNTWQESGLNDQIPEGVCFKINVGPYFGRSYYNPVWEVPTLLQAALIWYHQNSKQRSFPRHKPNQIDFDCITQPENVL